MELYQYTAVDQEGRQKKGTLNADSSKMVRSKLRQEGLIPLEVVMLSNHIKKEKVPQSKLDARVNIGDLAVFTRELGALLKAGLELEDSLHSTAQSIENKKLKMIILSIHTKIVEGYSFSAGLNQFPKAFPQVFRASVQAGEEAGFMSNVLSHLADYLEAQQRMRQKIAQILIYPTILSFVALAIVSFLLIYVAPKILTIFEESQTKLPFVTQALMVISDFLASEGWIVLLALIGLIIGFRVLMQKETFKARFQSLVLKVPFIGKMIRLIQTGRFLRTLSILVKARVPILHAVQVSADLVSILPIREKLMVAKDYIKKGSSIYLSLKETGYFAPTSLQFISSGEATGDLEAMLLAAAENLERHIQFTIDTVLTLFEPLLILIMGLVVLFIVLALLLPMFQLSNMVG